MAVRFRPNRCCVVALACLAAAAAAAAAPPAGGSGAQLVRWGGTAAAPEPVQTGLQIASIQADDAWHSDVFTACGLLVNGSAFCIDLDSANVIDAGSRPVALPPPVLVPGGYSFAAIVAPPGSAACGLLANGSAMW